MPLQLGCRSTEFNGRNSLAIFGESAGILEAITDTRLSGLNPQDMIKWFLNTTVKSRWVKYMSVSENDGDTFARRAESNIQTY